MKGKSKCSMFCNCKLLFMENSNGGFNVLSANRVNREVGCVRPCYADAPSQCDAVTANVLLNFTELRESDVFLCYKQQIKLESFYHRKLKANKDIMWSFSNWVLLFFILRFTAKILFAEHSHTLNTQSFTSNIQTALSRSQRPPDFVLNKFKNYKKNIVCRY